MSIVFLFGAGASYGSVDCIPHQPPLGNNLFPELLRSDGFTTTIEGELRCRFEEGRFIARGRQEFVKALPKICFRGASVLQIGRVVSHGRAGAVNGTIELAMER